MILPQNQVGRNSGTHVYDVHKCTSISTDTYILTGVYTFLVQVNFIMSAVAILIDKSYYNLIINILPVYFMGSTYVDQNYAG